MGVEGGSGNLKRVNDWEDVLFGSCALVLFTVGKCVYMYVFVCGLV